MPSMCQDHRVSLALGCHADTASPCQPVLPYSQGRKWWMNTDEPWQVLACCMEIAKASRSPDPATYISHFPVHQVGAQQARGLSGAGKSGWAEASRSAALHLLHHVARLSWPPGSPFQKGSSGTLP